MIQDGAKQKAETCAQPPYFEAVMLAIEEVGQSREWKYRGANLQSVIERILYIYGANRVSLRNLYQDLSDGKGPESYPAENESDFLIAEALCRLYSPASPIRIQKKFSAKDTIPWWMRYFVQNLKFRDAKFKTSSAELLIVVYSKRFVSYILPILEQLNTPYSFLVIGEPELADFLERNALPFTTVARSRSWLPSSSASPSLRPFTSVLRQFDILLNAFAKIRPRSVLSVEGSAPLDALTSQACKLLSIPAICLQQGWAPVFHQGFRNLNFAKMLVWGEGFAELLKEWNPEQKFVSTGSHIISLAENSNGKAISFFVQAPTQIISDEAFSDFLELIEQTATEFPDLPILVREHPKHPLSEKERENLCRHSSIQFRPPFETSLESVLKESFVAVSIYSTTILESAASGVIPIVANFTPMKRYIPDVEIEGVGIEVYDRPSAMAQIRKLVTDEEYRKKFSKNFAQFRKRYFENAQKEEAIQNIVRELRFP